MPIGFIKHDVVYFYKNDEGEFVPVGTIEDYFEELYTMEEIEFKNKLKVYEKHWYIPVPFTKKRLIFVGFKYQGWYTYK